MKFLKVMISALFIISSVAVMADTITLGNPGYGGSGCPAGSASVTLSPDAQSLSILFDQFIVEAGGITDRTIDRKSCNIAVPVKVPNGISVSIMSIDYRGFNSLPYGSSSRFSSEYFFAGMTGPKFTKSFRGPLNQDYILNNQLALTANSWSPCGQSVNLRVNTSMFISNSNFYENGMATVDSADFHAGIIYHLQFRTCH